MSAMASTRSTFREDRRCEAMSPQHPAPRRAAWYEWLAVALVVLLLAYAALAWTRPATGAPIDRTHPVHVVSGETLWSLARAYPTPGLSTAQNVDRIVILNKRTSGRVLAGEVLLVPAPPESGLLAKR